MTHALQVRLVSWVAAAVLVGLLGHPAQGEPAAIATKGSPAVNKATASAGAATATVEKAKTSKRKSSAHRLPPYYSAVVDSTQRAKIYEIQDEYAAKLETLKAQLEMLTTERDERVAAVLSEEQRAKVEAMKAEAKNKRLAKANGKRAAEGDGK
jgi:hypothetical protein